MDECTTKMHHFGFGLNTFILDSAEI